MRLGVTTRWSYWAHYARRKIYAGPDRYHGYRCRVPDRDGRGGLLDGAGERPQRHSGGPVLPELRPERCEGGAGARLPTRPVFFPEGPDLFKPDRGNGLCGG